MGNLDQVHRLRRVANLLIDVGRVGGLDVSEFRTSFDNIYQIVEAWREASTTGALAIFNFEIKERKFEVENRLTEIVLGCVPSSQSQFFLHHLVH